MSWSVAIVIAVAFVAIFALNRLSLVTTDVARKQLAAGALVIDVRLPDEFQQGHLAEAINVPLVDLRQSLPRLVKDKSQPLLVHCLSGGRSALAKRQLKSIGYINVFNLGSLARARQIVRSPITT